MAAFHWFSLFLILSTTTFVHAGRSRRSPMVTDDLAQPNQFRYAVAIMDSTLNYICSGGIIGETYILSAAHCFMDRKTNQLQSDEYMVYAGAINYNLARRRIPVKKIFVPSDYNYNLGRADIAVVELIDGLVTHKYNLQKLKPPVRNVQIGEQAVAAAFGISELCVDGNGKINITASVNDGKLRYAHISIVKKAECHGRPYRNFEIEDYHLLGQMIKNSNETFGMCYGDSGAPLVQEISSNESRVIGVMVDAFDEYCDGRSRPAIFTNVANYRPFIRHVITGGNSTKDVVVVECGITDKNAAESSSTPSKKSRVAH